MAAVPKEVAQKIARAPSKAKETKPKAPKPKLVKVDAPAFRDPNSKVILDLPAPAPCPFCKRTDCIIWTKGDDPADLSHFVRCEYCGSEGPFSRSAAEAANFWNGTATADPGKSFDGLIDGIAPDPAPRKTQTSPAERIVESAIAHRHSFDSLSMRARGVLLRGLKVVLDNSKTDEEFEEATALSALLIDDMNDAAGIVQQPKKKQFTDHHDGAPIEGLPEPAACQFCGFHEWTGIVTVETETTPEGIEIDASYYVQCDGCLAEGPPQASKLEAAQHWNKAARKVDYSIIEAMDSVSLLLTHLSDALSLATTTIREAGCDEDGPIAACIESAVDAKLEPAREQLDAVMQKLSAPKLAMTG